MFFFNPHINRSSNVSTYQRIRPTFPIRKPWIESGKKGGGGKNPSRYSIIGSPTKGEKVDRKSIHESAEACFTTGRGPRAITRTSGRLIALLATHQRRRTTHAELKRPIDRLESRFRWSRVRVCGSLYCTTAAAPWPRHFDPTAGVITPAGVG